tara:strand:+ start:1598 stop:1732 length:135 start_codon:yes stop_codon:yes gene_type:complete
MAPPRGLTRWRFQSFLTAESMLIVGKFNSKSTHNTRINDQATGA